ncbi:MAG TPA: O-antigen ligase family protein [Anaerolineae bacterium]|nr:O-antigen ligase family protein [Anaerolineae bacterium]
MNEVGLSSARVGRRVRSFFASVGAVISDAHLIEVGLPILVGLVLGVLVVLIRDLPTKWIGALVMGIVGIVFVLLIGDIKKIVLSSVVVDTVLEFDVAIQNRGNHAGGPTGYTVSLLTLLLIVGYVVWIAERKKSGIYWLKSTALPLAFFILMNVVSIVRAEDVPFSLYSIFGLVQVFLMYVYVINHVKTWDDLRLIFTTWIVCLLLESVFMAFLYVTGIRVEFAGISAGSYADTSGSVGGSRVSGTFGSPNGAAIWLTPSIVIAMGGYLLYTRQKLWLRWVALAALGFGVVALILTFSRSGWLALLLGISIVALLNVWKGIGRRQIATLGFLGLIVVAAFSKPIITRLTGDDRGSVDSRRIGNEMAFNMIRDQPFTGVGANNFDVRKFDYLPPELVGVQRKYVYIVHNHYWLIWAELGIGGLLVFLSMLATTAFHNVKALIRQRDAQVFMVAATLLGALGGYCSHMRSDVFATRAHVTLLWFMIALTAALVRLSEEASEKVLCPESSS